MVERGLHFVLRDRKGANHWIFFPLSPLSLASLLYQCVHNPINKFWRDDVPALRWQNEKWTLTAAKGKITAHCGQFSQISSTNPDINFCSKLVGFLWNMFFFVVQANFHLKNSIFPILSWRLFDWRNIYVLNLETGRPKQMSYVGEFASWDLS